jgi:pimeloyl-ACP methyl ester carboxylesterase
MSSSYYRSVTEMLQGCGNSSPNEGELMPQQPFRVTYADDRLIYDKRGLADPIRALPIGAPIVVMVHGFRFAPDAGPHCPFGHIFALNPSAADDFKAVSWPRHLGLRAGLAIGFGWQGRGMLPAVNQRAFLAGRGLAELAAMIREIDPSRCLDVIAHSMGARVALSALSLAQSGDFRRLILLAGAETRRPALRAMQTPAGRAVQVINVTSRENDIFDFLYEWGAKAGLDTAIGQGLGRDLPNWLNLPFDQPKTLTSLTRLGYPLPKPPKRFCHWSPYIRPGVFALYRALIDGSLPIDDLAAALPQAQGYRWERLLFAQTA